MTTIYPTSIDTLVNPLATDLEGTLDHASIHRNANDAITALETKVGVTGSAVNTTVDFKLSGVATGDKAASLTGTETLSNKTLTTPKIAAILVNAGANTLTLPTVTDTVVGRTTTDTLTNKTITDAGSNVMAKSLKSATTTVDVSAATAPVNGQVLTATSTTTATWQTPSASVAYSGAHATLAGGTITNATPVTLAWNGERFDTNNYHDNVTNNSRLTVPSTAKYLITCSIAATANVSNLLATLNLKVNGTTVIASAQTTLSTSIATGGLSVSIVYNLAATDYVEAILAEDSVNTLTYNATGSSFTITSLGV